MSFYSEYKPFKSNSMKKLMLVLSLLIVSNLSNAQWYNRKYKVNDINLLTNEQLNESLRASKNALLVSGCTAVIGGCFLLANKWNLWVSDTNPSFLEQQIGQKSMHDMYGGVGFGLIAGGTIAFFGYLERTKNIKMAIHRNFPHISSIHITPKVDYNRYTFSRDLGLSLTYNF